MPSLHPGPAGRMRSVVLSALVLLAASCGASEQRIDAAAPSRQASPADGEPSSASDKTGRFAAEEALGADCSRRWISDPPMQDSACYGMLPAHVAAFLRAIPDSHPYLDVEHREEQAGEKQRFVFVEGYGERPDVLTSIEGSSAFWIRSFEGPDPDVTVYAVFGPGCADDRRSHEPAYGEGCLPGYPAVMREIRIYRARSGEAPVDVTSELAPPAPVLTAEERRRYGVHVRPPEEGDAGELDVQLDVTRLDQAPVMRWVLRPAVEGDYQAPPVPAADPRAFVEYETPGHIAHFGFLVWDGTRFELRESVPADLWPCRSVQYARHVCGAGYEAAGDRYLIEAPRATPAEGRT